MKQFILLAAVFLSLPNQANSAVVERFHCDNALHWRIDAYVYNGNQATLTWSQTEIPNVDPFFHTAKLEEDTAKNITWFRFDGGYLAIERAFTEAQELSAVAWVKAGYSTSSYRCVREN